MRKILISLILLLTDTVLIFAQYQDREIRDTLQAAVKEARRNVGLYSEGYALIPVKTRQVTSLLGEGDAVKYIQTLPGVSTGGEGGSAIYVRGGNMGSNLMTLDGMPIYGVSHLLGLTTIIPEDVVAETVFLAGGFPSEDGNFTASHIRLVSKDGNFGRTEAAFSANPFLLGGWISAPIVKGSASAQAVIRVSPIGLVYKAVKPMIKQNQLLLDDFGALAGDAYGKLTWRKDVDNDLSLSFFGSQDRYAFTMNETSSDVLGWSNLLANLSWNNRSISCLKTLHADMSFNHHVGSQRQKTLFEGALNDFLMRSVIDELTVSGSATIETGLRSNLQFGIKVRGALFNPAASSVMGEEGRSSLLDTRSGTLLATLHGQWEYSIPDLFLARFAFRGNAFAYGLGGRTDKGWMFHPEGSLLLRWNFIRKAGLEVTVDALTQYYHTLEGIPLGWSLDMIVSSDATLPPERALQGYMGAYGNLGQHLFRAGAFYKKMRNLVYYGKATDFFNAVSRAGWHDNINVGEGTSYGLEFLYEKEGPVLSWRASYTWSKSDRFFPDLNEGRRFPAKYDRRHIAHLAADWKVLQRASFSLDISSQFTYQSGSWDTLQDGSLTGWFIGEKDGVRLPLISSLNNYQLPAYIRWDGGVHLAIAGKVVKHEVNIGVYNILNRHNPFMLRYNAELEQWETISLIPVLPYISYRVLF